jgi:hypothetical protein
MTDRRWPRPSTPSPTTTAQAEAEAPAGAKPLDYSLQNARYLQFRDPRVTAKSMAKPPERRTAFDDVFYGVATPFEIMLRQLARLHFDLRFQGRTSEGL